MVDCLSSNEVEVAEVLESNDKGWQLAGAVMLQCSDYDEENLFTRRRTYF